MPIGLSLIKTCREPCAVKHNVEQKTRTVRTVLVSIVRSTLDSCSVHNSSNDHLWHPAGEPGEVILTQAQHLTQALHLAFLHQHSLYPSIIVYSNLVSLCRRLRMASVPITLSGKENFTQVMPWKTLYRISNIEHLLHKVLLLTFHWATQVGKHCPYQGTNPSLSSHPWASSLPSVSWIPYSDFSLLYQPAYLKRTHKASHMPSSILWTPYKLEMSRPYASEPSLVSPVPHIVSKNNPKTSIKCIAHHNQCPMVCLKLHVT
jgi:hypothetical protein